MKNGKRFIKPVVTGANLSLFKFFNLSRSSNFFPQSFISSCMTFLFKGGKVPEISVCNVNCDLTLMLALITAETAVP